MTTNHAAYDYTGLGGDSLCQDLDSRRCVGEDDGVAEERGLEDVGVGLQVRLGDGHLAGAELCEVCRRYVVLGRC